MDRSVIDAYTIYDKFKLPNAYMRIYLTRYIRVVYIVALMQMCKLLQASMTNFVERFVKIDCDEVYVYSISCTDCDANYASAN